MPFTVHRVDGIPGKVVEPSEDCWSSALSEFEGPNRRLGLWAKAFTEAAGNEAGAKAVYLGQRANQLHAENEAKIAEAYAVRVEAEVQEAKRNAELAYTAVVNGKCPNLYCESIIPINSQACPKCGASFGEGAAWKVQRIDTTE